MKSVTFRWAYGEEMSEGEQMTRKFGELLQDEDHSQAYDVERAMLFFNGEHYFMLEANGCSCWDGDYDGWQFTKRELLKWAKARHNKQEFEWRKQAFEHLADWVLENIK